ncbi:adenylate cyclase type 10-like [Ooceraea biroi]|uniref:adenylate cyclase type 10-like n=1 Tax=Ooceraea biroi TaxID=2015173 RepID=UPI000F075FC2|nr:adenylate cyclase type 10-like [Ooceraea biroi]
MVQEILSHNGDVLKFSGDAFIVMWKLEEGMIMRDIAMEAIQTACIIQKHFGTYDTDVGVTLKVKLAIASGKTYFTSIGDPKTMSHYLITGRPVWDVKLAEGLCRGGDILVTPSSWQWANPNEYIYEKLPDGFHTLIIACSGMWYQSRTHDIMSCNHDGAVRPKVIKVAKAHLKDALRSYLLRPVVRSIEMDEPLEHLTEMRQVVIVFINVITANIEKKGLISLVNEAYKLVCGIVGQMQGCVNKMSLFDKDLLFLCIFGLRGYKHELESQIGLRCATKVRQDLLAMKNIKSVTVAVTTGMTYCGVVGHVLRREYTVIGMSVNKAARLMVAYSNKVICDRESFLHSRLEARHFILQEPRHLKGITNVGPVYEFQEQTKHIESELTWSKYPLLGREAEIKIFQQILTNLMKYSAVDKTAQRDLRVEYNTLVIKGKPRIGKTRLLNEIAQNIPAEIPCNFISLVMNDAKVSYSLIHLIFSMPLGFNVTSTAKEREDKLVSQLGHVRQPEFLCALNQPFNVHFAMNARYKALSEKQKHNVLQKFLLKLMRDCFRKLWVVIIDDAEYSDNDSMLLFGTMVQLNTVFFVLSVGHKLNAQYEVHPAVLKRAQVIELKHLDRWYHAALVCQILNVSGIPAELEKLIQEKSFGNPGWIESYLVSLMQSGSLVIMHVRRAEAEEIGYILPPISMLKKFVFNLKFKIIDEESITVCNFAKGFVPEEGNTEMTMDAIQKLFDLRIFGCARGDFTTSTRPLIFYRNVRKASVEGELECECVALAIPGKEDMILAAILEFVEVCLIGYNIPQARRLLHDAEVLLKKMFESNKEEVVVLSYLMAKIQTLQGRCYLENGLLSEAKKKLREAINSLGYNFPSYEVLINLETTIQYELLKWRLTCPMRWKINTTDEQSMDYIELLANCLAQMFDVFRGTRGMKKQTRLAAIWSLNAALDSSRNFYILCASFSNMMITAHVFKNKSIISCLENRALNICAKKRHSLEFQELNAIAEVYAGVFFLRWSRGEISKAIRIGFITIRMAQTLDSTFLKLLILPRLAHLLMITCRHSEAVALLRELEFVSQNNLDKSGRTWYYASCADMQLDTGFTILSFQNCEQYYLREGESIISLQDPEAERRYFTSMWLWCIRMQQWEATKVWNSRNLTVESAVDEHKVAATITALKKLEGLLLLYVGEVSNRNISALNTMAEIKRQLKDIKKNIKMVKIAIPRYMLLKAYYYMIQSQKRAALKMLRRTKKLSMKVDNRMIYTWANHCQQAWLGVMSSVRENLWKEKSASKLDDEWDEIDANDSTVVPFTFPLPRYVL